MTSAIPLAGDNIFDVDGYRAAVAFLTDAEHQHTNGETAVYATTALVTMTRPQLTAAFVFVAGVALEHIRDNCEQIGMPTADYLQRLGLNADTLASKATS